MAKRRENDSWHPFPNRIERFLKAASQGGPGSAARRDTLRHLGALLGGPVGSRETPHFTHPDVEKAHGILKTLHRGDQVKIKVGPLKDLEGVVDETFPTAGRVKVIVKIAGRATPVDLARSQIEKL